MPSLHHLRQQLTDDGILICFNGPFSHSIIEELGNAVKRYLEAEELQKSAMMDVFSVYIEATQNVRNYALSPAFDEALRGLLGQGIVVISKEGDHHVVHCGNLIRSEDRDGLEARLTQLRGLDKGGLKALYKEQMRRELPPGARGAGLGLIDMARKASAPLVYELTPAEEGLLLFSLHVTV